MVESQTGIGVSWGAEHRRGDRLIVRMASVKDGGGWKLEHYGTGAYVSHIAFNGLGLATLGVAGTLQGSLGLSGVTSGLVTVAVNAVAGTWTMTLPAAVGAAGEQLTDAAGNGVTSWAGAASARELKNITSRADSREALDTILNTNAYHFHYKEGKGTLDYKTDYVGIMTDEAPWAMHYDNSIVNPVNTLGYMVLGFQAVDERIKRLEDKLRG